MLTLDKKWSYFFRIGLKRFGFKCYVSFGCKHYCGMDFARWKVSKNRDNIDCELMVSNAKYRKKKKNALIKKEKKI